MLYGDSTTIFQTENGPQLVVGITSLVFPLIFNGISPFSHHPFISLYPSRQSGMHALPVWDSLIDIHSEAGFEHIGVTCARGVAGRVRPGPERPLPGIRECCDGHVERQLAPGCSLMALQWADGVAESTAAQETYTASSKELAIFPAEGP